MTFLPVKLSRSADLTRQATAVPGARCCAGHSVRLFANHMTHLNPRDGVSAIWFGREKPCPSICRLPVLDQLECSSVPAQVVGETQCVARLEQVLGASVEQRNL